MSVRNGKRNTSAPHRVHNASGGNVSKGGDKSKTLRRAETALQKRVDAYDKVPAQNKGGYIKPGRMG